MGRLARLLSRGARSGPGLAVLPLVLTLLACAPFDEDDEPQPKASQRPVFDVLYRPPIFVRRGQSVDLEYELVCPLPEPPPPRFCVPEGSLHVRRAGEEDFDEIELAGASHRATATVPAEYTSGSGFDYYVEIRDENGNERVVPDVGKKGPQRAWAISGWTNVELGTHAFGATREGFTVVAAAGLGRRRSVGPSAFDVAHDGTIVVLDQLKRQLLATARDQRPRVVSIEFVGGEGDLVIGRDGTTYVLDYGRATTHVSLVRSYGRGLEQLASTRLAAGVQGTELSVSEEGASVYVFPAQQWIEVGAGADLLPPEEQAPDGGQDVAVHATPRQLRLARFDEDRPVGSWQVGGRARFGEVQLAEPYRSGLLVVVRVREPRRSEWLVLELTPSGVAQRFSIRPVEQVDATSRFRLHEDALYELQSLRSGVRIVRHDLRR